LYTNKCFFLFKLWPDHATETTYNENKHIVVELNKQSRENKEIGEEGRRNQSGYLVEKQHVNIIPKRVKNMVGQQKKQAVGIRIGIRTQNVEKLAK
jgi:hypothetical protein